MYNIETSNLPASLPLLVNNDDMLLPFINIKVEVTDSVGIRLINECFKQNRLIGIVQSKENGSLYSVGCMGKIIEFIESTDNKYYIEIYGICRFRINELIPNLVGYNEAKINFSEFTNDVNPQSIDELDQEKLAFLLKSYFAHQGLNADWQALKHNANEQLINSLASTYPLSLDEKQTLIEADNTIDRAHLLAKYLTITNDN